MKAFLDTSVLVAALSARHPHHIASLDLLRSFKRNDVCCGTHSLAELYSTLTGKLRAAPNEALLALSDVRDRLTIISLSDQEYFKVIEASAGLALAGGAIYDAILGHCALKGKAAVIYTWNTKDFLRLGTAISSRVKTPAT
jgi:predicted nucleic acid-binding protein